MKAYKENSSFMIITAHLLFVYKDKKIIGTFEELLNIKNYD